MLNSFQEGLAHVLFNGKNADLVHEAGKAAQQGSESRGEDPGDVSRMVCGTDGKKADGWNLESRPEVEEKGQEEKKQKKTGISIICLSLFLCSVCCCDIWKNKLRPPRTMQEEYRRLPPPRKGIPLRQEEALRIPREKHPVQ